MISPLTPLQANPLSGSKDCSLSQSGPTGYLSRDELKKLINGYRSAYREEEGKLAWLQEHIDRVDDPFGRATISGHITASGIAVHKQKILMIFHPFLEKWLLPGGHVEAGETPLQTAKRELLEETGMHNTVHPWHTQHSMPLDIGIHRIPANPQKAEPAHQHYDFKYLLCIDHTVETAEREMDEIRWMPLQDIDTPDLKLMTIKLEKQGLMK